MELTEAMEIGLRHHREGRLGEAEAIYRQILQSAPTHPDVLHLLGLVLHQRGDHAGAADHIGRAIKENPGEAHYHNNLGSVLKALGRLGEAVACFRQAMALREDYAEAVYNLGNALRQRGDADDAEAAYREALRLVPDNADALNNLGTLLKEQGRLGEAERCFRDAAGLAPEDATVWLNLGVTLGEQDRIKDSLDVLKRAVGLAPGMAEAHYALANAYRDAGLPEAAEASYRRALGIDAEFTDAYTNLGAVLLNSGRAADAVPHFKRAAELNPGHVDVHENLVKAYLNAEQAEDAVATYRDLVSDHPDDAEIHAQYGICLLLTGRLKQGFREYEWRWKTDAFVSDRFPQPLWDGSPLDGKTILLRAEQGMGDLIQFVRYVPLVAARGGRVVLECYPPLRRLFSGLEGPDQVIVRGEEVPPFDVQVPLVSLPRVFGSDVDSLPSEVPYLMAPEPCREAWREPTGGDEGMRVGLIWAGSPDHPNDSNRSLLADLYRPLLSVPGVTFHSLQTGDRASQLGRWDQAGGVRDLGARIHDFADAAAAMEGLDLVITVDTAPAHLAGALGRPVWVLLPHVPDWRWMLEREDSPWYPTMRLFRQSSPGNWAQVVERVKAGLTRASAAGGLIPKVTDNDP